MSTKVKTGVRTRFSYVHVHEAYAHEEGQKKKYSVSLLIPKDDTVTIAAVKAAIQEAAEEGKGSKFKGKIPKNLQIPLRDGDEEREDSPEYAGHFFINANSNNKPGIVNRQLQEITTEEDFYSGCYGRAAINFFPYNFNGKMGIACGLNHLQKLEDGDNLGGGGGSAADAFDDDESESIF